MCVCVFVDGCIQQERACRRLLIKDTGDIIVQPILPPVTSGSCQLLVKLYFNFFIYKIQENYIQYITQKACT